VAARYRIVRRIGSGATGDVYEALDSALGGAVALKTLKPAVAGHAIQLERFRREIQSARKVTHPNVCRIFDMAVDAGAGGTGRFFLTMELLPGPSLNQRLEAGPRFSAAEAFPILAHIADGLSAAHAAGVIHRDLKPGNIMLVAQPGSAPSPRAVITDFGIALSDEQGDIRLTQSGELVGTPEYMAPEQADNTPGTPAIDIYALGLIAYEMLSGRLPFDAGDTPLETVLRRRREPPRPLRDLLPDVDRRWEAAIFRCLDRAPERRFQRAAQLVAALGREP
jgi:serine/threonine protein kinase